MWASPLHLRLDKWREFRHSLDSVSLEQALEQTQNLWKESPNFAPFYLDPDDTKKWPDPWQLITENYFCNVARCLGIIYTIYFSGHKNSIEPELRIYKDGDSRQLYSLVWLNDGKYILNLETDEIVNTQQIEKKKLKLLKTYSRKELKLDEY